MAGDERGRRVVEAATTGRTLACRWEEMADGARRALEADRPTSDEVERRQALLRLARADAQRVRERRAAAEALIPADRVTGAIVRPIGAASWERLVRRADEAQARDVWGDGRHYGDPDLLEEELRRDGVEAISRESISQPQTVAQSPQTSSPRRGRI